MEVGVLAQPREDLLEVCRAEHLGAEGAVLVGELGDLLAADLVNLAGVDGERRVPVGGPGVALLPVGEPAQTRPVVRAACGDDFVGDGVAEPDIRRPQVACHHIGEPLPEGGDLGVAPRRRGAEAGDEGVLRHVEGEVLVELGDRLLRGGGHRGAAPGHSFSQPVGPAVELASDATVFVEHRLGVLGFGDGELADRDRPHRLGADGVAGVELGEAGLRHRSVG